MKTKQHKPYISADSVIHELTPTAIILGIILAVVFGGANAYLGLRVGMTVSASIPAAVISMGIIRFLLKKNSILENNIVQTIGSAGESVAAGAIFTLPTLFIWATEWGTEQPSALSICIIALCGGILGVLFMIPLRSALIVKEKDTLPYPEGTACAEVLLAGEEGGGSKASLVFAGLGISAAYKFIVDGFKLFPSVISHEFKRFRGCAFAIDGLPALLGVGFICGFRIASYLLGGSMLAWFVIMPLLKFFGGDAIIFPATVPISQLSADELWSNYIRYIGAGAVAAGGIISLIKALPLIFTTFFSAIKGFKVTNEDNSDERTNLDLPYKFILPVILVIVIFIWLYPPIPVSFIGAILIAFFGFFFATVSSRLVGLVGSSNNPVSGMAVATLIFSSIILKFTGLGGKEGMMAAIAIGSVICVITAVAGDTSQDLKTGFLLGATPKKQQIGEIIGVIASSLAIGGVLFLLNKAWGYGTEELPAPQAMLMKMVVEGVMGDSLPWNLVGAGAFVAVVVELIGIPVLPFAVGLYLPIELNAGIMAGSLIRVIVEKNKKFTEKDKSEYTNNGILYTSGFIAGEGLVGILLAFCAIAPVGAKTLADVFDLSSKISFSTVGSIVGLVLLLASIYFFATKKDKKN